MLDLNKPAVADDPIERLAQVEAELAYFKSFGERGFWIPSQQTWERMQWLEREAKLLRQDAAQQGGRMKGGQVKAARAKIENEPIKEAYRAWRYVRPDRHRNPKAAFIREWLKTGVPRRSERQLYCILSAEP